MAREKEGFRDQLESVIAFFPDKEMLTQLEVARYIGRGRQYVAKHIPFTRSSGGTFITRTQLARFLCG